MFPYCLAISNIHAPRWSERHTAIFFALVVYTLILFIFAGDFVFDSSLKQGPSTPLLYNKYFITSDNAKIPVRKWLPDNHRVMAVIIALHGFLKDFGIASYAYDQCGFGNAPHRGYWTEINISTRDLTEFTQLIRNRHPDVPLFLLGKSISAAEIIVAMTSDKPPPADGVILSAPAVWAWESVPWYQKVGLWLANHAVPWLQLTGASLHLVPTDNIKMLRELSHDPLVLKKSSIRTIYGLADLMNRAFEHARQLDKLTLVFYGERDEIVPRRSVYRMLNSLPPEREWRVALYENGYHMLLRDLEAQRYWRDIAAWINNPSQKLPSGADKRAATVRSEARLFYCVNAAGKWKHSDMIFQPNLWLWLLLVLKSLHHLFRKVFSYSDAFLTCLLKIYRH